MLHPIIDGTSILCQVLSCLYGMDIRDAELASLERKRGGKAKKRKKKAEDDVATSFKEANAGVRSLAVSWRYMICAKGQVPVVVGRQT